MSALVWTGRRVLHLTQCAWVPGYYAYTVLCSAEDGAPLARKLEVRPDWATAHVFKEQGAWGGGEGGIPRGSAGSTTCAAHTFSSAGRTSEKSFVSSRSVTVRTFTCPWDGTATHHANVAAVAP